MKTVVTKEIDGFQVVLSFSKRILDPEKTKRDVAQKAKGDPSYAKVQELGVKIQRMKEVSDPKGKEELKALKKEFKKAKKKFQEEMLKAYDSEKSYFDLKKGEFDLTEELHTQGQNLFAESIQEGKLLSFKDGVFSKIENNIGKKYFVREDGKLVEKTIDKIGVPVPSEGKEDLSESELNEINEGLFKDSDLKAALSLAAIKMNEFQILGDASEEALLKAKTFYEEEKSKIETKYA